ncbi:MAG: SIR2 family protein [Niastella sp.]|nr:SIR2 family protein [Niastella sp.]
MSYKYIYQKEEKELAFDAAKPIESTAEIRNGILSKFFSADNLNFLMSNGCSYYAGSKAINEENEDADCAKILTEFEFQNPIDKAIQTRVNELAKERPELALDKLFELKLFYESTLPNTEIATEINDLIENFKEAFVKQFVLNIDYNQNKLHKSFLKRLLSRDSKLSKPNIFTLNYDLLFEMTAEKLGIFVNNGFTGFHERAFYPSAYQVDYHIKNPDGAKRINKSINLYKLHGSLSWYEDENKPPYGIGERQVIPDNGKIEYDTIREGTIIYPVQSKKKHSLDLPYSEMLRQFVEALNKHNSVLIIAGYSFLDEHINDIIANAIANPDFNLVIFSYEEEPQNNKSNFLKQLYADAKNDTRITMFYGNYFGDFENIINVLMPFTEMYNPMEDIFSVFQSLKKATN